MAYTIIDLLDKFILIEKNGYEIFMAISSDDDIDKNIKTIARIFAKEEERHINLFNKLRAEMEYEADISVDFDVYDKAAKLVSEFAKAKRETNTKDSRKLLEFCLNFEKENLALALSVQGILVKSEDDTKSKNYNVLSEIITEEQNHVQNIERFLK